MKRMISMLLLVLLTLSGCTNTNAPSSPENPALKGMTDGVYEGTGVGYGGPVKIELTIEAGKMSDIQIIESHESSPVQGRMLAVIKERILDAQTPIVDNVTAATFSSYAVKAAVAEAAKQAGTDFGEITMTTSGPVAEQKQGEDVKTQVVIIGGGPAGLAAAIAAKESGVNDVIVVEKLDILSGNGKFDMSFFDVINSKKLQEQNKVVSKEEFIESKLKSSMDSPARIERWAEEAWDLDAWLRSFGVELNSNSGTTHQAEEDAYGGEAIQDGMEAYIKKLNVDVRTGTQGTDLIFEGKKVTGVKVESKTEKYNILADAVIVATGGFCTNKEMLAEYAPGYEILNTSNQIGTTGDFVKIFEANDIQLSNMDQVSVFKTILKPRRDLTGAGGGGDGFLFINENGERFIAENSSGLDLAKTILEQEKCFYFFDQRVLDTTFRLQKHVKLGYYLQADTLDEMAELMGVPAENLKATIDTYNKAIKGEGEDPFRDTPFTIEMSEEGPYFAAMVESAAHMTKGGVLANENAQVLYNDDTLVEGLYAAGEVTATSGAYSTAVMFGRVSGTEAAKYVLNK